MGRTPIEVTDRLTDAYVGINFYAMLLDDQRSLFAFTANASTDVITATGHDYINDMPVTVSVSGGGTLPAPLVAGTTYYVRDVATNTFKLSATIGGEAINITDAGTGSFVVTDIALSIYTASVAEMARKEISSYGALTNRPLINFTAPIVLTPSTNPTQASITQALTLDNSAGVSDLPSINCICVIRGGSATPFNTSGKTAIFNRLLSDVVVVAGSIEAYRIPITATIAA